MPNMPYPMSHYDDMPVHELTALIGYEPQSVQNHDDYSSLVTDYTKPMMQQWIKRQGIAGDRIVAMRAATLANAYLKPAYLHSILTRGDYNKDAAKALPAPRSEPKPFPVTASDYEDHARAQREQITIEHEPQPAPAPAPAVNGDAAAQLAALIGQIAGSAVNEARVIELIKAHAPKPDERVVERIVVKADGESRTLPEGTRHKAFATVLRSALAGNHIALYGPAGSGKTTLVRQVVEAMNLRFDLQGPAETKFDLSGYNDANGKYVANSRLYDYVKNGGGYLLNEFDGSMPGAGLFANQLTEEQVSFPHETVSVHPEFRLFVDMNTLGHGSTTQYQGRCPIDGAPRDRFRVIKIDYDEDLERTLYGDTEWCRYVHRWRAAVEKAGVEQIVSGRAIAKGTRELEAGASFNEVKDILTLEHDRDTVAKIEATMRGDA